MKNENHTIIILTEGKTDLTLIKIAQEKLNVDINLVYHIDNNDRGDSKLYEYLEKISSIPIVQTSPIIFIFDRDNYEIVKKVTVENKNYKKWTNNIYSFAIPIPKNREGFNQISIEHYFSDQELKIFDNNGRRFYFTNEFNPTSGQHLIDSNIHYAKNYKIKKNLNEFDFKIIDSNVYKDHKNIALSKNDFVKYIENNEEPFCNISFENFNEIFNIISDIKKEIQIEADEIQSSIENSIGKDNTYKYIQYNDYPPTVQIFVGRQEDLKKIDQKDIRVISLTGLGGEGKSTLAAKYYDLATKKLTDNNFQKFGWYDCKELETPFHEKLASLLEMLTNGVESKDKYSEENVSETIMRFINFLNLHNTLIVFDNVDAFVDNTKSTLTGNFKILFESLINRLNQSLVIFTARSPIEDFRFSYLEIPIVGLKYNEVIELASKFGIYKNIIDENTLKFIFEKSKGHALWLNLIFAQLRSTRLNSAKVNDIFSKPSNILDSYLLNSIWQTLSDLEKEIIWIISTFSRPPEISKIQKTSSKSFQKCQKALQTLEKLRLVIEIDIDSITHYDLHPIIMMKAKEECKPHKQAILVEKIISFLSFGNWRFIVNIVNTNEDYTSELDGYLECAEIAIKHCDCKKAIEFIHNLVFALNKYGEDIKFIQLCNDLFAIYTIDIKKIVQDPKLELIVESYLKTLLEQGEYEYVNHFIKGLSINIKTIKELICFSTLQSYNLWFQNKFSETIEFTEKMIEQILEKNENVPSSLYYDLALAKRDNGEVKYAIDFYINKNSQEVYDLWDPKGDNDLSADVGNLGRCYYLIGDYEKALNYLLRSIEFLKRNKSRYGKVNYGYGLLWVSDIYIKLKEYNNVIEFLNRAVDIWSKYCPSRLKKIDKHIEQYPETFKQKYKTNISKNININ